MSSTGSSDARGDHRSPEPRRLSYALLLSLLIHALLLSLTFGGWELWLPGFGFPWRDRRNDVPDLRVVLVPAQVTAAEPAVAPVAEPLQQAWVEPPVARGPALTPFVVASPPAMYALLFFWGGIGMGIYTIGLTLIGERFKGAQLASANAAFVMLYSIGLLGGPLAEGVALDAWNPHGLMVVLCCISLSYAAYLMSQRRRQAAGS